MQNSWRCVICLILQHVRLCLLQWPVPCHAANRQLLAFSDQSRGLMRGDEEWAFHSSSHYWMLVLHATLTWHLRLILWWEKKHFQYRQCSKLMCHLGESSVSVDMPTDLLLLFVNLIPVYSKIICLPIRHVFLTAVLLLKWPDSTHRSVSDR